MPTRKLPKSQRFDLLKRLIFTVCLLLVLVGLSVGAWFGLSGYLNRAWDGKTRFTIVIFDPQVQISSFDPVSREGVNLYLPEDLEIETIGGRGSWRAGVISQAGGAKWAGASVAHHLGISHTGVGQTLGWWDKLQWRLQSRSVKWRDINLKDSQFVSKQEQPDGVNLLKLNTNWDSRARELFADQGILQQSLGLTIVNTVSWPGLGQNVGRVVESMGFKVRSISTSQDAVNKCIVKSTQDLKGSISVLKLLQTFNCDWEQTAEEDLQLLMGNDFVFWKWGVAN